MLHVMMYGLGLEFETAVAKFRRQAASRRLNFPIQTKMLGPPAEGLILRFLQTPFASRDGSEVLNIRS